MTKLENVEGLRFGRLVIVKDRPDLSKPKFRVVECLCDCGKTTYPVLNSLRQKITKSCGCLRNELTIGRNTKHGLSLTYEYRVWNTARRRCYNVKDPYYHDYGGRGITMCDEWKDDFEAFYKDMGIKPEDKEGLDRHDKTQGFNKDNCYWANKQEKTHNRSNSVLYTIDGKTQNLREWCMELGLPYATIYTRIYKGMSFQKAISKAVKPK